MSKFKVGDRVQVKQTAGFHKGAKGTIHSISCSYVHKDFWVMRDGASSAVWYREEELELLTESPENRGAFHKHHDLIIAWAKGAKVQVFVHRIAALGRWEDTECPSWSTQCDYRIKPEPKPDIRAYLETFCTRGEASFATCEPVNADIVVTFDGETGKLKAVELIS